MKNINYINMFILLTFFSCTLSNKVIDKEENKTYDDFYTIHCKRDTLLMKAIEDLFLNIEDSFPSNERIKNRFVNSEVMTILSKDTSMFNMKISIYKKGIDERELGFGQKMGTFTFFYDIQLTKENFNNSVYHGPFIDIGEITIIDEKRKFTGYAVLKSNWVNKKYGFLLSYNIIYRIDEELEKYLREKSLDTKTCSH